MSASDFQTEMLIGRPNPTKVQFDSNILKLCLPRENAARRLLLLSFYIKISGPSGDTFIRFWNVFNYNITAGVSFIVIFS